MALSVMAVNWCKPVASLRKYAMSIDAPVGIYTQASLPELPAMPTATVSPAAATPVSTNVNVNGSAEPRESAQPPAPRAVAQVRLLLFPFGPAALAAHCL